MDERSETTAGGETEIDPGLARAERAGRYRLLAPIGEGGQGEVYAAVAEGSEVAPWVAVKVLAPDVPREALRAELRAAAALSHPFLVPVIDAGEAEGRPFVVMPLVLGETLATLSRLLDVHPDRERPDRGPLAIPPLVAARAIADACEALHAAHELGIVHRDVTPPNLLIGFDGIARVLDFGMASGAHVLARTATGEIRGTLGYIAPERLEGAESDRRADVWSLAVVLWEWIAGRRLYGARTLREMLDVTRARPAPSLRDHVPDAPLALEEVLARALARDPERRPASARALGRELLACLADEGVAHGPADLAAWIERVAAGSAVRQRRLLERARAAIPAAAPPARAAVAPGPIAPSRGLGARTAIAFAGGVLVGAGLGRFVP